MILSGTNTNCVPKSWDHLFQDAVGPDTDSDTDSQHVHYHLNDNAQPCKSWRLFPMSKILHCRVYMYMYIYSYMLRKSD